MSAPTIPAQAVPCETCDALLPNLLATCRNADCFAADIDAIVAQDLDVEAGDE